MDPKFATGKPLFNPSIVAQQAQDPNNAAHPQNPKVGSLFPFRVSCPSSMALFEGCLTSQKHHEWAKNMASRFGSAVVFGAGATFGGDMVNDALRKF